MRKFTEKLHQEMQLQIQRIGQKHSDCFEHYSSCYQITRDVMQKLKIFITSHHFKDRDEEITFFKEVKPKFQSRLMYYLELIQIEIQKPAIAEKRELIKYYRRLSHYYSSLSQRYQALAQYMRTQLNSSDHVLFVRASNSSEVIYTDSLDFENQYSTPASIELSKIICYEMVIKKIGKEIDKLKSKNNASGDIDEYNILWTGNKVALIELAYALHSSNAVNHGHVDIKQIIKALEYIFKVELGNFYRVFQNIRIRQSSRTAFLEELIEKLEARMDETDLRG